MWSVLLLLQVQFNGDLQVAYGIKDGTLYILNMRDVITAALAGTEASAPNMEVLNTTTPGFPIQDVSFCSSAKGSFVAIATEGATKVDLGYVIVYRTTSDPRTLTEVARVRVGALPDQLTFRKEDDDCAQILVANGELPKGGGGGRGSSSSTRVPHSSCGCLLGNSAAQTDRSEERCVGTKLNGKATTIHQPPCVHVAALQLPVDLKKVATECGSPGAVTQQT
jgi:hypothetical protein